MVQLKLPRRKFRLFATASDTILEGTHVCLVDLGDDDEVFTAVASDFVLAGLKENDEEVIFYETPVEEALVQQLSRFQYQYPERMKCIDFELKSIYDQDRNIRSGPFKKVIIDLVMQDDRPKRFLFTRAIADMEKMSNLKEFVDTEEWGTKEIWKFSAPTIGLCVYRLKQSEEISQMTYLHRNTIIAPMIKKSVEWHHTIMCISKNGEVSRNREAITSLENIVWWNKLGS